MPKVDVSVEDREFIAKSIARFQTDGPAELHWQRDYVREHQALPLYVGWTETIGLRADGEMIRWSTESEWPGVRELDDRTWVNMALVQGATRYPELQGLIPKMPPDARICENCDGTGRIKGISADFKNLVCSCGGIGWMDAEGAG
jgi:hypothetical protein